MDLDVIKQRGLVLIGCGKMGGALLQGWLDQGVPPGAFWVRTPNPAPWLRAVAQEGLHLNTADVPAAPAALVLGIKPQKMDEILPDIAALITKGMAETPLIISVAAGTMMARLTAAFGPNTRAVRAMPNTPSSIGRGMTAIIGNDHARAEDLDLTEALLRSVGDVIRLENEGQMDAVTAVSGSGPAYVFYMIEALAAAGEAQGLPQEMAMHLAQATVAGAAELARTSAQSPAQLRTNVASPGGTTAAGLNVLADPQKGLAPLMRGTVAAAAARAKELAT